jgi:hypothetical protein
LSCSMKERRHWGAGVGPRKERLMIERWWASTAVYSLLPEGSRAGKWDGIYGATSSTWGARWWLVAYVGGL